MLKRIPKILSPDLMKVLLEMGHGDDLLLADGNFPAAACARRLVRADGLGVPELLDAILQFFPLDSYVAKPVGLTAIVPGDTVTPTIWDEYKAIVQKHESKAVEFELIERFAFYERAKQAFAIVATGEKALYANIILKKGVVTE